MGLVAAIAIPLMASVPAHAERIEPLSYSRGVGPAADQPGYFRWAQFLLVLPPLLAVMAAMPLLLLWIMGASAFAGTSDEDIFG